MDVHEYYAEILIKQRLEEARANAQRVALVRALRPPRQPVRVTVGLVLIGLGARLLHPYREVVRTLLAELGAGRPRHSGG